MSDKIIHFEEQQLNNKLKTYKEDLHTNYIIGKREIVQKAVNELAIEMNQYDLYNMHNHESYMTLTVIPDLGLVNIEFSKSDITCALAPYAIMSISEYETFSIGEIESMIIYIQFSEIDMSANDFEPISGFSLVKESLFYEEYLHALIAIKYCLISITKLYV